MAGKPVVARTTAGVDIDAAFEQYLITAGPEVASRFMDALEVAFSHISRHPGAGSPRYAHLLQLPGLRSWPLTRFPYLVFYMETPHEIDVLHVLHGSMDLPEWLDH